MKLYALHNKTSSINSYNDLNMVHSCDTESFPFLTYMLASLVAKTIFWTVLFIFKWCYKKYKNHKKYHVYKRKFVSAYRKKRKSYNLNFLNTPLSLPETKSDDDDTIDNNSQEINNIIQPVENLAENQIDEVNNELEGKTILMNSENTLHGILSQSEKYLMFNNNIHTKMFDDAYHKKLKRHYLNIREINQTIYSTILLYYDPTINNKDPVSDLNGIVTL